MNHLIRLWHNITPHRHKQFVLLLILMVFVSFAEIVSIGAIMPFLGVLTAPEKVFSHPIAQPLIQWLHITQPMHLLLPLTVIFAMAALTTGFMRLLLLWASTRLSFAAGADLSIEIYRRTLYQPYSVHISRNSSEVINGITSKVNTVIFNIIAPLLTVIASSVILGVILFALLAIEPMIALMAFGGFGLIYALIIRFTRYRLATNSRRIANNSSQLIKSLTEGLGGIRDVLIDGSQPAYCRIYRAADLQLRRADSSNIFIGGSPRFAMEALGMVLIAAVAYTLAQQSGGVQRAIPILGALAIGAQRLLPVLQQIYSGWSSFKGGQQSLQDALDLLEQPLPNDADQLSPIPPLPFKENICCHALSFRYSPTGPWVLRNLSLTITKGSRVGFIGVTGSGKSTLLDIIMGLLDPTEGGLFVDSQLITHPNKRAWQAHIAHVPQTIFLSDASIAENIAFSIPGEQIDYARVSEAAHNAQIAETIEGWKDQYQTRIGERGIRLSGGQRQRIGIARALYKQADIIILDEATSALDNDTEHSVMHAIEGLCSNLTILIIAHRLSTLKNCTQIIELGDNGIKRMGSYQDMILSVQNIPEDGFTIR